jgi:hypothetical protein
MTGNIMKNLFIYVLMTSISPVSFASGLNDLALTLLDSARFYNAMELATREALEANIRIRRGISGFIASQVMQRWLILAKPEFRQITSLLINC